MDRERYQKLKQVFLEALELSREEREAFVRQACHGDEELRCTAEKLLADHAELWHEDAPRRREKPRRGYFT